MSIEGLLDAMLSSPHATEPLLSAAGEAATAGHLPTHLRPAVLSHPHTSERTVDSVLASDGAGTPADVRAVCARPGALLVAARRLLEDDQQRARTIGALTAADGDQLRELVRVAGRNATTRDTIVPSVINADCTTVEHTRALTMHLVTDPRPLPAARTWLRSLLERRAPVERMLLCDELTAATTDPVVTTDLVGVRERAHDRHQAARHLAASTRAHSTTQAWLDALSSSPDVDGVVSAAAIEHGDDLQVLSAVTFDKRVPSAARRTAWLALVAGFGPQAQDGSSNVLGELLEGADSDFVRACASDQLTTGRLWQLLTHRAAPADVIDQLAAYVESTSLWVIGATALYTALCTHPAASPAVRERSDLAAAAADSEADAPEARFRAASLRAVHDGLAAAGSSLRVQDILSVPAYYPGVLDLRDAALAMHLPQVHTTEAARTLFALQEGFTGTLGELFDVATAVAT